MAIPEEPREGPVAAEAAAEFPQDAVRCRAVGSNPAAVKPVQVVGCADRDAVVATVAASMGAKDDVMIVKVAP